MFFWNFSKYLLARNLQHLIVHVTNRCDCRCKHCFVDFSKTRDLPLDLAQKCGREIGKLFWLDIGGGEPFLREDLPELISAFDSKVVMIPSNGIETDRIVEGIKAVKKTANRDVGISFSLEGLKETNDRIRRAGSWDAVWRTFEAVKQIDGISVKINTVLTNENAEEIMPLMEVVRKQKPDFHSVILLRGTPSEPAVQLPSLPELRELVPKIIKAQGNYDYGTNPLSARILRNYHKYAWKLSLEILEQKRQIIPCLAGQAHMVINPDGTVSSCEMLPEVGNLHNQSWAEIVTGERFKCQKKSIASNECSCTHNCALLDSILFRPASIPKLVLGKGIGL